MIQLINQWVHSNGKIRRVKENGIMAKKKTEEKVRAIPIDYIKLVDDMSEKAFQFCVDQLYPLSNYRVLQKEDIRRVDLKERLLGFNRLVPTNDGKEQGALNYYLFVLKLYFDNFISCKDGSKAQLYRKRAMELMESALSDKGTIEDVEDLVQIYISLFRSYKGYFEKIQNYTIAWVDFNVYEEDANMLKEIWEQKNLMPNGIVENQGLLDKIFKTDFEEKTAIKLAYINNVIFLCRCLQNRGAFVMEEE